MASKTYTTGTDVWEEHLDICEKACREALTGRMARLSQKLGAAVESLEVYRSGATYLRAKVQVGENVERWWTYLEVDSTWNRS